MNGIDILATQLQKTIDEKDAGKKTGYDTPAEVIRVDDTTIWVKIPGGVDETPISKTMSAKPGDTIQIRVAGGKAWAVGNYTSPATDDTKANEADARAGEAMQNANLAQAAAELANIKAQEATADAERASIAAASAESSAGDALQAAQTAQEMANDAAQDASDAKVSAENAEASATAASANASAAFEASQEAISAASIAEESAATAEINANSAATQAQNATTSANAALSQLSEIEKVVDVLNWVSEHGEYSLTADTSPTPNKWYFVLEDGVYSVVTPAETDDPSALGYYELTDVDAAISNYISSHLALTSTGLWVQMDDTAAKLQISSNGITLWNESGSIIANYSNTILLGDENASHLVLSGNRLGFWHDASTEVAYISAEDEDSKLYITETEITSAMRIGNFIWKVYGDFRISLRYSPK